MRHASASIDPDWWPAASRRHELGGVGYTVHEWPGAPSAPTMLLLHGWMDTGAGFGPLAAALGDGWRRLAPDWRGFGDSDRAPEGRYWFPDYLADLDALIDRLVPAGERVVLVGHSMGGNVAGLYAGVRPERVRAVVSLEGFGLPATAAETAPGRYREWLDSLAATPRLRSFPDYDALADHLAGRNPHMPAAVAAYLARCWGRGADGAIRLRGDPAHRRPNPVLYRLDEAMACWRAIDAPVLWLWGEDSAIVRRLRGGADWSARLACFADPRTAVIPAAGHALHQERAPACADAIHGFLAETGAAPRG